MVRALMIPTLACALAVLGACRSHTSSTRSESTMGTGSAAATNGGGAAPIFAEICVPTSLPPGRYALQGGAAADALPRALRELRVAKGCVHPLAVRVCPNELRVEQEGSVLVVASDTVKRCYEATVTRYRVEGTGIHARVTFESKCGKENRVIFEGELVRVGP